MKIFVGLPTLLALVISATSSPLEKRTSPQGIDVSHWQGTIDWSAVAKNGVEFAYIKATEGTSVTDAKFSDNYNGATKAGVIRGGYHFAHPDASSGAVQAKYFLAHGGGWSGDGQTLPGALDIEYNPNGATCYGKTAAEMVAWIKDFSDTYYASTKRYPVIYTTTDWWKTCTGNSATFSTNNPLWIARYASAVGTLPSRWSEATFWQYADSGSNPGDQDVFSGSSANLKKFATS